MNEQTLKLFQTLTELPGAPGNEHAVRQFMKEELRKYSDEVVQDKLGSIFGIKKVKHQAQPLWWPVIWMKLALWSPP